MIPFTAEISPRGANTEELLASLVTQERIQNIQLREIIKDLYREIDRLKAERGLKK